MTDKELHTVNSLIISLKNVLALLAGGIIAAPLAAFICKKLPQRLLGISVGITVIILSLSMILRR